MTAWNILALVNIPKALIVVDVQKFFLHDAPDDLPRNIANHIEKEDYKLVAFTVFKNHENSNFVRSLDWHKCYTPEDTQLPEEFSSYLTDMNVFTRATYSGFSDTDLDDYLRSAGIQHTVICGVDTDD